MATKKFLSVMIAAAGFGYAACAPMTAKAADSLEWLVQQMSISDGSQAPSVAPTAKASTAAYKPKDSQDKSGKDGRDSTAKDKVSRAPVAATPDQTFFP